MLRGVSRPPGCRAVTRCDPSHARRISSQVQ